MQKKKNENKLNLPSVTVLKPTQNSKCYTSKANLKCREVQQKNIYFQMPSIHQNDLTMKTFIENQDKGLKKIQFKILKFYQQFKDNKMTEEWDLYMKKSEIINSRITEFYQVQEFLLKNTCKLLAKINQTLLQNTFSFNKSKINQSDNSYLKQEFSGIGTPDNYKTLLFEKSLIEKDGKSDKNGFKSLIYQDKSRFGINGKQQSVDPINALSKQNALLDKKAQLFEKRIIQLEEQLQQFEQKEKDIDKERDVTSQLMTAITLKNKYRHDSQVKTLQLNTLNEELIISKKLNQSYQLKIAQLQSSYKECKQLNIKYKEYLKYKELWLMSTQETQAWRVLCDEYNEQNTKLSSKVKMLKDKNKQLLNYFNMSNAVNPDQQEDKQDLDKIIKQFKQWLMIMSVPKVNINQPNSSEGQQFNIHDLKSTEVGLKLLRPNFYVFFEAFENTLLMEKNIINIRPVQYHFFLKIRSIFDTMYNAFQIATSYKEYPSFPEYVIGFLQKYQINPTTNLVQYRKKPIENQEKLTFLVNLFNKNFCNTWQCDIFKNFLFENYTLDEVYFFLDCRNQLNSGISSTHTLGSTDPISYVKLSKALKLVAKKLAPYQNYIIQRVKSILKSKKKIKYAESFIDKHFVLKLLLQVYGLERSKSERVFQFSFKTKMKKSYITFGDFHNFMCKNFYFLSSIQIAQLYRQAYTLSSGHLTYKAIHYICGMKGLFIPLLLARRINKNMFEQTLNNDMLLLDIQNSLTKMNGHFEEIGVQSFMRTQLSINNFMRQLDWYKNNKSAFYQRFAYQATQLIKLNMHFFLKSSHELTMSESLQDSEIQNHMIQLHSLIHQTDTQVHYLTKQKDKRNKAMTMLIRNFKIRIQQSMQEFQKVNEEEIHKLKDQIQRSSDTSKLKENFLLMGQTTPS